MAGLKPDRYLTRVTQVDPRADLLDAGYTHVLLDVDNTILPRDNSGVPEDILAWIAGLREAGISVCLLSNNWHQPVLDCAAQLDLPIVTGCVKPLPFAFFAARRRINAPRKHTRVIGDQLVTDVWGAHLAGLRVTLVQPLVTRDLWHTRALRHIERVILRNEQPEGGKIR